MTYLTMSYEYNLAKADHIIQEQRKRITELDAEVEKQQTMRRNALRKIEELRPELNDTVHDLKLENQRLRAEVERLREPLEKARDIFYVIDGVHHTPARVSGITSIHVLDDFIRDIQNVLLECEQALKGG